MDSPRRPHEVIAFTPRSRPDNLRFSDEVAEKAMGKIVQKVREADQDGRFLPGYQLGLAQHVEGWIRVYPQLTASTILALSMMAESYFQSKIERDPSLRRKAHLMLRARDGVEVAENPLVDHFLMHAWSEVEAMIAQSVPVWEEVKTTTVPLPDMTYRSLLSVPLLNLESMHTLIQHERQNHTTYLPLNALKILTSEAANELKHFSGLLELQRLLRPSDEVARILLARGRLRTSPDLAEKFLELTNRELTHKVSTVLATIRWRIHEFLRSRHAPR